MTIVKGARCEITLPPESARLRKGSDTLGIISAEIVRGAFTVALGSRYVNIDREIPEALIRSLRKKELQMVMGAKVFTATKAKDREELGEVLTRWIRDNPRARILDKIVTQSSDSEFHCLTITIFYEMQPQ
jgi:hypothetical protein